MCSMNEPHQFLSRILFLVSGLTPQIVTETLFALAVTRQPLWVPTEIRILTTKNGYDKAVCELLDPEIGWFYRLLMDYKLPAIDFNAEKILVLNDSKGRPMTDIRSAEDNTFVADAVTKQIQEITKDDDCALHVSIAGGRKTMGFYAGYALSLYGRAQDRLSHVLVESQLESNPMFFYPAPDVQSGKNGGKLNPDFDSAVHLAEIPFVRMRDGLSPEFLKGHMSFSEVVSNVQKFIPQVHLSLDARSCTVVAGGESFTMRPSHFAFLWMLADRARTGKSGVHWSERSVPAKFLIYYGKLVNRYSRRYEAADEKLRTGLTKLNFDAQKSQINRIFVEHLGPIRARPYRIVALDRIPGTRYARFGLSLPPRTIRIVGEERTTE